MKIVVTFIFIALMLLFLSACGTKIVPIPEGNVPNPGNEQAADDVLPTPGGWAYRANINPDTADNPFPPIDSHNLAIYGHGISIYVTFRDYIETKAGETRNNIFSVGRAGDQAVNDPVSGVLRLYLLDTPQGITLTQDVGGGRPGLLQAVLMIDIAADVAPGLHNLRVGIEIDGKDFGSVPFTINVIPQ
jgi:hypothetical protein